MARNTSVSLSDHFTGFIEDRVASGRYASASDVIRAGLRLLEEEEARLDEVRRLVDEGLASGPAERFDWTGFRARKLAEHRARTGAAE